MPSNFTRASENDYGEMDREMLSPFGEGRPACELHQAQKTVVLPRSPRHDLQDTICQRSLKPQSFRRWRPKPDVNLFIVGQDHGIHPA
jgi:hypothetical protein